MRKRTMVVGGGRGAGAGGEFVCSLFSFLMTVRDLTIIIFERNMGL